ncbi:MAG: MFS transporter [Prevotella sp.]|nr:MFS transporter [Prevotella sp.]
MSNTSKVSLVSVMLCFFAMGFVDLVGIASNYVKADLALSDSTANMLPSLVFFWFLIFSVPTGMLMNKIGRKNTVLVSLAVTVVSLSLPLFGASFPLMLISFSLLGIGNALMQTSLNPLVQSVIRGGNLASTLTFGQFVKAIASFMAPYIAMWGAMSAMPSFGMGWRILFPVYMVIGIAASVLLLSTPIEEEPTEKASSVIDCVRLLSRPVVLLSFLGIMCHVGIDVGTNTTAPKILMERLGMTLNEAAFATSLYFIFRTVGCLTGSFFLRVMSNRLFFNISVAMMALAMLGLGFGSSKTVLYVAIALVGYGNSNIFSLAFSEALLSDKARQNEISGLMIMGLFGGTVFPLLMGYASDAVGQLGAVGVMALGVAYLAGYGGLKRKRESLTPNPSPKEKGDD